MYQFLYKLCLSSLKEPIINGDPTFKYRIVVFTIVALESACPLPASLINLDRLKGPKERYGYKHNKEDDQREGDAHLDVIGKAVTTWSHDQYIG